MFSVSAKYSFPIHANISDISLLEYLQKITDDELLSIFKIYSKSYEERRDPVAVISEFTNLINFIENEQQKSEESLKRNLKNVIDLNVSDLDQNLKNYISKFLKELLNLGQVLQMTPKPEYLFEHLANEHFSIPTKVIQLAELTEFILFATNNYRRVNGIPAKFSDLKIPDSNQYHLLLDQRQILLYQVQIDVLRNITLHFIENPDAGLPIYFYEMESKSDKTNFEKPPLGRRRKKVFTKEKVKEFVDEFLRDYSYPKPQKFWHIGGVHDGAIVKSELAKYILFEQFKATEDQFSLKSIESRIEEVMPNEYLPAYRKKVNRKKKK